MFRLVLAGDAGAGKSSFLLRLTLNDFRGDIPTTLGKTLHQTCCVSSNTDTFWSSGVLNLLCFLRCGFPDQADAGGWRENKPADLGHSRAGEVLHPLLQFVV